MQPSKGQLMVPLQWKCTHAERLSRPHLSIRRKARSISYERDRVLSACIKSHAHKPCSSSSDLQGFKEEDKPNFTGSYYSHCKAICENLLAPFENVLTLRVRMPIVADLLYHRNFITKIIKYNKVVNIPNSMTVLPELIPIGIESAKRKLTGIMNYTNPGAISHNEILELYKEYIDPEFSWENFNLEEQVRSMSSLPSRRCLQAT